VDELRGFFDEYRGAFARGDRDALAAMFAFPVQVVSASGEDDGPVVSVAGEEEWGALLERLLAAYRGLGVTDAAPLELAVVEPLARVASARVHWELRREDGSAIYDFNAVYTLVRLGAAWRVAAIVHDELPKLHAAMRTAPGA
jgi:Domain of unknown function (DUF4440)